MLLAERLSALGAEFEALCEKKEARAERGASHLAFAIYLAEDIDARNYENMADAARQLGLTKARISPLKDLALLAADIQEQILATRVPTGRTGVNERTLRPIVALVDWRRGQAARARWRTGR